MDYGLSKRQVQILRLVAEDKTDVQIAEHLHLSPDTVHTHMRNIRSKMGVSTRTGAVVRAMWVGLIGFTCHPPAGVDENAKPPMGTHPAYRPRR